MSVRIYRGLTFMLTLFSLTECKLYPCVYDNVGSAVCWCSKDGAYTDCSRQNLCYIPAIPNTTVRLNISRNSFTQLDISMLINITNKLTDLDVSINNISRIEEGFFFKFETLKILHLSNNPLTYQALRKSLWNISASLNDLFLSNLTFGERKQVNDIMEPLNGSDLSHLELKFNHINNFNSVNTFMYLKHIKILDLSFNYLVSVKLSLSHSLKYLRLSYNDLTNFPQFCAEKPLVPKLEYLYMDQNCISTLEMGAINCLSNLKHLNLSQTRINTVHSNTFRHLNSLQTLTLNSVTSMLTIQPYAFQSSTLEYIALRYNDLQFKTTHINITTVFAGCPELNGLDISGNFLGRMKNNDWTIMLKNIPKLIYLDISLANVLYLPRAIPQILLKLQQLHAGENQISYIHTNYFQPLVHLKKLSLSENKITVVEKCGFPQNLTLVNLKLNPFVCDCRILWFKKYIAYHRHIMSHYPTNYYCSDGHLLIANFNITQKSCLLGSETSIIIKCTCIAVILLIFVISGVYRYRWRLRYILYILKYHRRSATNCSNCDFRHDVFISCSDQDFCFVYDCIVSKLEEDDRFMAYLPERDAKGGDMKITNTLEHMDKSKFVLLCLSDSYARDHWCEFEACMALDKYIYDDKNSLIVILLEEISFENVSKGFLDLLKSKDYLIWDSSENTSELFWMKLRGRLNRSPTFNIQ